MFVPRSKNRTWVSLPPTIVVVADVHRHVHVLDAVNEEPQGEPAIVDRFALVLQGRPELVDLVDHAALLRIVCRPLGVVRGFIEGDVDVMPGSSLRVPPVWNSVRSMAKADSIVVYR